MINNDKSWHEKLSYILLDHHTLIRFLTGATPYMLVCGTKAVLSINIVIPSFRIIQESYLRNVEWVCAQ